MISVRRMGTQILTLGIRVVQATRSRVADFAEFRVINTDGFQSRVRWTYLPCARFSNLIRGYDCEKRCRRRGALLAESTPPLLLSSQGEVFSFHRRRSAQSMHGNLHCRL